MNLFTSLINSYFHEPHASLLNGILLGRPLFVTNIFYNQLKAVGLIHIVVLSGMNISLLSAIVLFTFVPIFGRKIASFITIVSVISFVLFVGAEAPVVRAAIMGILSIVGLLFGRRTFTLYLLFLSGFLMIVFNRAWLTSISFQLSFAATLGIIMFGAENKEQEKPVTPVILTLTTRGNNPETHGSFTFVQDDNTLFLKSKILNLKSYFLAELRISLSAQIFTLPLIFWYFRQISFIAPLANILVAWMIAPIMILGIINILLGFVSWHSGFVFSWILFPFLDFIVKVVEIFSHIPFASVKI